MTVPLDICIQQIYKFLKEWEAYFKGFRYITEVVYICVMKNDTKLNTGTTTYSALQFGVAVVNL
jgi:hypothetical protein